MSSGAKVWGETDHGGFFHQSCSDFFCFVGKPDVPTRSNGLWGIQFIQSIGSLFPAPFAPPGPLAGCVSGTCHFMNLHDFLGCQLYKFPMDLFLSG